MMSGMGAGLMMGLMWLVPLIVIGLLVWAVMQSVNGQRAAHASEYPAAPAGSADQPNPAFAILAERYARGELSREEFLERRRDLQELSA